MMSPGPSLPLKTISSSLTGTIPVSDPANIKLLSVIVYLIGLSPFLSIPPMTHSPSYAAIAAGPSQGSITALANSYIFLWLSGISLLLLDQASGNRSVLVRGADLPALTNISKAASNAEESELPRMIIGFT